MDENPLIYCMDGIFERLSHSQGLCQNHLRFPRVAAQSSSLVHFATRNFRIVAMIEKFETQQAMRFIS